jgi:hypothetical protein
MRLLAEVDGSVAAGADAVADALRERLRLQTIGEGAPRLEIDELHRAYALEGGWWYRGEYAVAPSGDGTSTVTLRVYDVAKRLKWGVGLANRGFVGFAARTRRDFEWLLAGVASDLQRA